MSIAIPFLEINSNQGRIGRFVWSNNRQAPKGFCFLSGEDQEFKKPRAGERLENYIDALICFSQKNRCMIYGEFNGISLQVSPLSTNGEVDDIYTYKRKKQYKEHLQQAIKAKAEQQARFNAMLQASPQVLTLRNHEAWQKFVAKNCDDPYGLVVLTFAEYWARFMEGQIAAGHQLGDIATTCSEVADTDGISGYMYGCAVSILSLTWIHGEDLRRWHNKKTQFNGEGDKANEDGGVLNPALLVVDHPAG